MAAPASDAVAPVVRVSGLFTHPVKSMAVRPLERARVERRGVVDDRSWVVVDDHGDLVTARELPALFTVLADTPQTDPTVGHPLRLRMPGHADHLVETPRGTPTTVNIFGEETLGVPADDATQAWLRQALGRTDLHLLWGPDPGHRRLDADHSREGDHTGFADCFPVTLVSEASLRQLNDWIATDALERGETPPPAMEMGRFRPNFVVEGCDPFAEDGWSRLRIGEVVFRHAKPAARCVMTTMQPTTLVRGKEPIRTLARHRREGSKTLFAVHLVPEGAGTVRLGDEVVVED